MYINKVSLPESIDKTDKKLEIQNHTPGSHSAINWADHLCAAVQHAVLPLHLDGQRQQGVLHPEREGRG